MSLALATSVLATFLFLPHASDSARGGPGPAPGSDITPIPMENLNPRLTEFRRIDSNNDDVLSFTEFILSDRPYIESQSRRFHQLDANSDGRVSRSEFENFFRERDAHHGGGGSVEDVAAEIRQHKLHTNDFFKQLGVGLFDDPNAHIARHHHHHLGNNDDNFPQLLFSFPPQSGKGVAGLDGQDTPSQTHGNPNNNGSTSHHRRIKEFV